MAAAPARLAGEAPRPALLDRAVAISGAAFVVLFAGGLIVADLVATTRFPTPTRPADEVVAYFTENRGAVGALATLHAFAALALLVFAAHLSTVLRAIPPPAGRGLVALALPLPLPLALPLAWVAVASIALATARRDVTRPQPTPVQTP